MNTPPVTVRIDASKQKAARAVAALDGQNFSDFTRDAITREAKRRLDSIDPEKIDPRTLRALVAALEP